MRAYLAAWLLVAILCCATDAADKNVEPIVSHIPRLTTQSTALASIGYSRRLHALEIEFRDGLVYRYLEVPPGIYRELLSASSKARFYNRKIRGKYRCLRVKPPRRR